MLFAGPAAAGGISVPDDAGRQAYIGSLNNLMAQYQAASNTFLQRVDPTGEGFRQWYNPIESRNEIFGKVGFDANISDWSRSNLRIYDIYEQLGGNAIDLQQDFRYSQGRFYAGLDTVGGAWFDDPKQASGSLLKSLIQRSVELPDSVKEVVAELETDDLDKVLVTARDAMATGRAFLRRGVATTATLTGEGIGSGGVVILGPDGVIVQNAAVVDADEVKVDVFVLADAPLGPGKLMAFRTGEAMNPLDGFDIFVVPGGGSPALGDDDHGATVATATTLTPGVESAGRIEQADDEDLFAITVGADGMLSAVSGGGSDLVGQLEQADGTVVAVDDDGGDWYNFVVSAQLAAGTYFLRVRHCCAGTGDYAVQATVTR